MEDVNRQDSIIYATVCTTSVRLFFLGLIENKNARKSSRESIKTKLPPWKELLCVTDPSSELRGVGEARGGESRAAEMKKKNMHKQQGVTGSNPLAERVTRDKPDTQPVFIPFTLKRLQHTPFDRLYLERAVLCVWLYIF